MPRTLVNLSPNLDRSRGFRLLRTGAAPLELVLCMPVLLAVIVGIVWLGAAVIAQAEVTTQGRHAAWSKRSQTSGKALLFLKDDIEQGQASQSVDITPLLDGLGAPQSAHAVMAASWDHRALPLDKAPNWKAFATAALNAKTAGLQTGYVDARNELTQFKSQASNLWNNVAAQSLRQLTDMGDVVGAALQSSENAEQGEQAQAVERLQRRLDAKQQELERARRALRDLDDDAPQALKKIYRNRVDRLAAEADALEADLEAME